MQELKDIKQDALNKARILANTYGHKLERPVVYTQGVAITARIMLAQLDYQYPDPTSEISDIIAPYINKPENIFTQQDGTANYAGINWAYEMSKHDERCKHLLIDVANQFLETGQHGLPAPLDPDYRVEDIFFAGTILQRATRITGDTKYVDIAADFLQQSAQKLMQPDGIYWHCISSPYPWGRGNGFTALGFAETLKAMNSHQRDKIAGLHIRHLNGLRNYQDAETGMWRQVINRKDSYLEQSSTSMIGIAIAIGISNGWLDRDEWLPTLISAWQGVSNGIDNQGRVSDVCIGTGPLNSLHEYINRDSVTGFDDRGGAMALWFAVETIKACK